MTYFTNAQGRELVLAMTKAIHENALWLSELDGAAGDGDHGINMDKGFQLCAKRLEQREWNLAQGLEELGTVLLEEVGGAMGPLYGAAFLHMATTIQNQTHISAQVFSHMLHNALIAMCHIGGAKLGDKTLIDVLDPALKAFNTALDVQRDFSEALDWMIDAAVHAQEASKDYVAKIGRASRLGERSRGLIDAGAASCRILIQAMAKSAKELLVGIELHAV